MRAKLAKISRDASGDDSNGGVSSGSTAELVSRDFRHLASFDNLKSQLQPVLARLQSLNDSVSPHPSYNIEFDLI